MQKWSKNKKRYGPGGAVSDVLQFTFMQYTVAVLYFAWIYYLKPFEDVLVISMNCLVDVTVFVEQFTDIVVFYYSLFNVISHNANNRRTV